MICNAFLKYFAFNAKQFFYWKNFVVLKNYFLVPATTNKNFFVFLQIWNTIKNNNNHNNNNSKNKKNEMQIHFLANGGSRSIP